eukprot:gene13106-20233_t
MADHDEMNCLYKDINIQPAFEKLVEQIVANDNPKTDDANADRNNA